MNTNDTPGFSSQEPVLKVIVMAAGLARRFGSNKLLADFHGKPLIRWTLETLREAGHLDVFVVWHDPRVEREAKGIGFKTLFNPSPEAGQTASIHVGLQEAGTAKGYMFLTADQPLLTSRTISDMTATFVPGRGMILMASCLGKRGNPVIFDAVYKDELMALTGDTGGRQVIQRHPEAVSCFEVENSVELMDIDRTEDLDRLKDSRTDMNKKG